MTKETLHQKLLEYYHLSDEEFFYRKKLQGTKDFIDPYQNKDFCKVVDKLKQIIKDKKKVLIYGDYDYDGISSTTIIKFAFNKLGGVCERFIPSRYIEGYGLNKSVIDTAKERGYDVIITVDNGITKLDEVQYCLDLGLEVVIIDHHEAIEGATIPTEYVFHQFVSKFTDYNISAAFLCLFVSYGLIGYYDDYLVTLAGIAVLSDCMPMKEMNIALVRNSLSNLNKFRYKPLIRLLDDPYNENIDFKDLNFSIIAKINAINRILEKYEANRVVDYLLCEDVRKIYNDSLWFNAVNREKKSIVNDIIKDIQEDKNDPFFFKVFETQIGLSGLIASRLLSNKDVVGVFIPKEDDNEIYICSLRAKSSYNLLEAVRSCSSLLEQFGGHKEACGVTVKKENYEEFITKLRAALKENQTEVIEENDKYIMLSVDDLNHETIDEINEFKPFSLDFAEPNFAMVYFKEYIRSREDNHVIVRLDSNKSILYFNGKKELEKVKDDKVLFIGKLESSVYNGNTQFSLKTDKVKSVDSR